MKRSWHSVAGLAVLGLVAFGSCLESSRWATDTAYASPAQDPTPGPHLVAAPDRKSVV